ncbi:hypothetical protein BDV37DRAFT_228123 [Aspergillus pseudonomiae]|uniref:Pre-mRNA-splicing factor 18 n=2 Tax=Aspergillus subgen. Circumdati TaxID=2720871 RepID=A0A0L1J9T1_ASPN3|nr:mRNA splicing factor (Prp18) [Aspergillus nomiae NRRL 13137]XP_031936927.1 uncharacterized protein BDV37DRAFT_228123 [Aspergillus pseudonomiae]KAE8399608.1 hypothetical protein BDV37DRAFT_228123 [Aspergillus pseudonomiae]KNG88499.1 mRNA splicing factor (Prp18) [Aspergillus nomiae NRRL 13137]
MDFAALMSKEISKAKNGGSSSEDKKDTSKPPEKKYIRRSELEAARIAAYNEEQERAQREREERMAQKRKLDEEEAERRQEREEKKRRLAEESRKKREEEEAAKERERRKRLGLPELPPASEKDEDNDKDDEEDIPDEELLAKLRELDEPARLFGETHRGRLRRYQRLTQRSLTPQQQLSDGPIPTTLELVSEKDMKISTTLPKDTEGRKYLFRQLASYFNMVLGEWELALAKRDISVKQSHQGRQAYNAMVQSRENMKPLFRKFEKVDVDDSVLEHVVEIVHKAQLRRYVDANDAYLRLSIGKAAWPIGVTMVGIHERSAREKLHQSDQQAHILSDEITRKYLQSIKRCLSFAQTRWPPDDQLQIMG